MVWLLIIQDMKKVLLLVVLLFVSFSITAQDMEANREIMKKIIADYDNYIHATAVADSFDLAVQDAVAFLASQIVTDVKSESVSSMSNKNVGGEVSGTSFFSNVVKTFSDVRLTSYHAIMVDKPGKKNKSYSAFVYISIDDANEIIDEIRRNEEEMALEREKRLKEDIGFYYFEGTRALEEVRIGDALKCFYWAYVISLDCKAEIEQDGKLKPAQSVLEMMIDQTLNGIYIVCEAEEEERVNEYQSTYKKQMAFYYKSDGKYKKITCLDFKYNDGNTFVGGPRVRDGVSVAELNYDMNQTQFHIVYRYDESETPAPIYEIMKNKRVKAFASAEKNVAVKLASLVASEKQDAQKDFFLPDASKASGEKENGVLMAGKQKIDSARFEELSSIMKDLEYAIRNKDYNDIEKCFTAEGMENFNQLIKYGKASIIGTPHYEFVPFDHLILCRSLTMQFRFRNNKQFVENVTFRFNEDNHIESLAFALTDVAQHDILDNEGWKMDSRLTLLTFMEDYQTAYALRRIDYLERIFSENALIISGCKVMKKVTGDGIRLQGYTRYDTLSKSQYMNRLRNHFKNKEYINLNFTETDFSQAYSIEDFFGIRVRQEYFSSSYGDVGYLFLLVDLRGDEPVIHIRAWQDDKLPLEQLFSLKDVY